MRNNLGEQLGGICMGYIIEIISRTLIVFIVMSGLTYLSIKEGKSSYTKGLIKLPKLYFFASAICSICFLGFITAYYLWAESDSDRIEGLCFFTFMFLLTITVIVAYYNWQIVIVENKFTYRTFFRRSFTYELKQAWIKYESSNLVIVKAGSKTFFIDPHADGVDRFLNMIYRNKRPNSF
jgi:hypothetical protein